MGNCLCIIGIELQGIELAHILLLRGNKGPHRRFHAQIIDILVLDACKILLKYARRHNISLTSC